MANKNIKASTLLFYGVCPLEDWSVIRRRFDWRHNTHYESLFTIGSGYLNVRASLPEGLSSDPQNTSFLRTPANVTLEKFKPVKSKCGAYVPGFMARHPLLNEEVVNLPFFLGLEVHANGQKLDMEKCRITGFCQWIDLQDGCVHRTFVWRAPQGAELALSFHAYVHFVRRQLVVQSLILELKRGRADVRIVPFSDADVRTNGYDHFAEVKRWGKPNGSCGITAVTHNRGEVAIVSRVKGLSSWKIQAAARKIALKGGCQMTPGQIISIEKLSAVSTSLDSSNPRKQAGQILAKAQAVPAVRLYAEHRAAWDRIWSRANTEIDGDRETALALRFSVFHMLRADPRNPRAAICAKMNGGDAYWGRIHWDNEVFIAPFFLYTLPAWAKPLFEYRHKTLSGAKQRAKSLGYPGAMYAWESGSNGAEECPSFQYADHEVHISSDVALGLWHYVCATNDQDFLKNCALEVIFEVARFWLARCDKLPGSPFFHILCTMGPDEYSHASNDNAYTNFTAARTLLLAARLYKGLRGRRDMAAAIRKLGISAKEAKLWEQAAHHIYIPYDKKRSLLLQAADFEWKAPIDFKRFWRDTSRPFGHFVSQERLYRSRALKQADVLMLMQLFPTEFSAAEIKSAFEYYEPYTTHDSSLSVATHCIISAWLNQPKKAWQYFERACSIDLAKDFYGSGEGIHSANAGALWQCVVFGFAGMMPAYLTDRLTLSPRLPKRWKALRFQIVWQGIPVKLELTLKAAKILAAKRLQVCVAGKTKWCEAGETQVFVL